MPQVKNKIEKLIPDKTIVSKIYVFRGKKVMLDFDLAVLYDVETKRLNEQVKRNIERFPEDFMFRLTSKEWSSMRSQFATASHQSIDLEKNKNMRSQNVTASQKKRNTAITPYAFTEHGVTMLASVLKSSKAIEMSIAVVRAFIALKKIATTYSELAEQLQYFKDRIGEHDVQLSQIYDAIENLLDDKVEKQTATISKRQIGFKPD